MLLDNPPKRMKEILSIKDKKEQDRQISLWGFENLSAYKYKNIDLPRPATVNEYYALAPDIRKKMNQKPGDYKGLLNNPEFLEYFDQVERIKTFNSRNLYWLKWYREVLNGETIVIDIDAAIETHQQVSQYVKGSVPQPSWND